MANRFERMNNYIEENDKEIVNEKGKEKNKNNVNKNVNKNNKEKVDLIVNNKNNIEPDNNENSKKDTSVEIKTTRFVESLLQKKKEDKELVGFRLRKSTADAIEAIVKQNGLKKSEFVDDILRKALGLN